MHEDVNGKMDDSMFNVRASESINAMLACILDQEDKTCKHCNDVDVCAFLTEAIFTYRYKFRNKYSSAFET